MDKYTLIYDHRNEMVHPFWFVLAVLATIVLYYLVIKKSALFPQGLYTFLILACVGCPFGLYIFISLLINNNSIKTMMNEGKYFVVEGEIVDYSMFPYGGKEETFTLNATLFRYSQYDMISSYHNANPEKQLIKGNGQYVRIGYYTKTKEGDVPRNYIVLIEELK